MGILEYYDIVY